MLQYTIIVSIFIEDTRINLIERIRNSLSWFYHQIFPESPKQSRLPFSRLLEPIYHPDAREATSIAYLVVHALTHSYLGFTQPYYHDFLSSVGRGLYAAASNRRGMGFTP